MKNKTQLQQQIETETGFAIEKAESREQLDTLLTAGLTKLYQEVFADPPYNETFIDQEVIDEFRSFLDLKGCIFVAKDKDTPIAFVASIPLVAKPDVAALTGPYIKNNKDAVYFAEDGVAAAYRCKGLSSKMKQLLIEANAGKTTVLRTSQENYRQISATNKAGGYRLTPVFQDVTRKRLDGTLNNDRNSFFIFDTEKKETLRLESVLVTSPNGRDTAIIFDNIPVEEQKALSERIKEAYPALDQVIFTVSNDNALFKGRMYLAKKLGMG